MKLLKYLTLGLLIVAVQVNAQAPEEVRYGNVIKNYSKTYKSGSYKNAGTKGYAKSKSAGFKKLAAAETTAQHPEFVSSPNCNVTRLGKWQSTHQGETASTLQGNLPRIHKTGATK